MRPIQIVDIDPFNYTDADSLFISIHFFFFSFVLKSSPRPRGFEVFLWKMITTNFMFESLISDNKSTNTSLVTKIQDLSTSCLNFSLL